MSTVNPIIEAKNISFAYDKNTVLDNISLTIEEGDYVGIVGPNGGGKTTLLKILVGLLPLQTGSLTVLGQPFGSSEGQKKIGYVPQHVAQNTISFPATVFEVVASGLTSQKKWLARFDKKNNTLIDETLAIAGISDLRSRLMSTLSGGQQQRVYVARALVRKPAVLILDEPFVGVDAATQKDFYAFLKKLNTKQHLTILFVSHDIEMIVQEVKSILCLNQGLLCFGDPHAPHQHNVLESLHNKHITHLHH